MPDPDQTTQPDGEEAKDALRRDETSPATPNGTSRPVPTGRSARATGRDHDHDRGDAEDVASPLEGGVSAAPPDSAPATAVPGAPVPIADTDRSTEFGEADSPPALDRGLARSRPVHANPVRRASSAAHRRPSSPPASAWPQSAPLPEADADDQYDWPAPPSGRTRRFLPWLDWKYSVILPVALLLILVTLLWQLLNEPDLIQFTVEDSSTGSPIAGALVTMDGDVYMADDEGVVVVERPDDGTTIHISADGYIAVDGTLVDDTAPEQTVSLRPSTLIGQVLDRDSGEPIAGATVSVFDSGGVMRATTTTDDHGAYRLVDVPENATLNIDAGRYGIHTEVVGERLSVTLSLQLASAEGVILDERGEPVQGAVIQAGDTTAVSAGDGTFVIDGASEGAELTITASGFERTTAVVSRGRVEDVSLVRRMIRAIYANESLLGTPGGLDSLVEIADTTEINAIVIDVKQGTVYFDSQVQFFHEAGSVRPLYDLDEVIATLDEHDIYTIGRLVVFQDPIVANARPDLAVHDIDGGLWVNRDGVAWVSAFNEELWDANIELAVEVINRGFAEVQYDYVRFPSDGDLSTADFGREYTAEAREAAITEFMKRSHEAVHAAGGLLAADLFGYITLVDDEQNIGQRFSSLEPYLDFVCMMIYPSHFEEGNIASAPGHPNDYPYETIFESLERAEALVPGSSAKFRPWLQDFSYGFNGLRDYTAEDVRAQIDAAEEFGTSGWMLWGDPFDVTVEALAPDSGQ